MLGPHELNDAAVLQHIADDKSGPVQKPTARVEVTKKQHDAAAAKPKPMRGYPCRVQGVQNLCVDAVGAEVDDCRRDTSVTLVVVVIRGHVTGVCVLHVDLVEPLLLRPRSDIAMIVWSLSFVFSVEDTSFLA